MSQTTITTFDKLAYLQLIFLLIFATYFFVNIVDLFFLIFFGNIFSLIFLQLIFLLFFATYLLLIVKIYSTAIFKFAFPGKFLQTNRNVRTYYYDF